MSAIEKSKPASIDPETLAAVAREVLARLDRMASDGRATPPASSPVSPSVASRTDRTAAAIETRLITADTIGQLPVGTAELFIAASAVITPSAKDEARKRGIVINRSVPNPTGNTHAADEQTDIVDSTDPGRAAAVRNQLARRSLTTGGIKIVLSDTPARDVYRLSAKEGEVAVMVNAIQDVHRFATELEVTAWVLDMKRLNLTAAVNVAAQIMKTPALKTRVLKSRGPRQ